MLEKQQQRGDQNTGCDNQRKGEHFGVDEIVAEVHAAKHQKVNAEIERAQEHKNFGNDFDRQAVEVRYARIMRRESAGG